MARKLCKMEECLSFDQDESLTVFVKFDKGLLNQDIEQLSSTGTSLYVLFDLQTSSSKYALLYGRTKSGYGDVLDPVRPSGGKTRNSQGERYSHSHIHIIGMVQTKVRQNSVASHELYGSRFFSLTT